MSDTPNSLAPVKPSITKMSKWPLYCVIAAGLILFCVLFYSVNFAHNEEEEQAATTKVEISENEKPLIMGPGNKALIPPPNTAIAQPEPAPATPAPTPEATPMPLVTVVQKDPAMEQLQQEQDNIRRMRGQAQLSALASPLAVKKGNPQAQEQGTGAPVDARPPMPTMDAAYTAGAGENAYNPAEAKDKEGFFDRAQSDQWTLEDTRTAGQQFELKTGAVIPGVMVTGINSDLPGNIIAQVSQNVWDSATGKHLLIPQGSRLFGVYDSRVTYGQQRVLVAWNRLIFPDGSSVTLGAMPGTDISGNAGYADKLDNHYLRIFGSALLMSAITGGMAYTMDTLNNTTQGTNQAPTLQDSMGAALAAQLGQTTTQLLQKNLNIKPTIEVRPGYQFNIVVTKDIAFAKPYTAWR